MTRAHRGPSAAIIAAWAIVAIPSLFMGLHADDWFQLYPRTAEEVLATFFGDWNSGERNVPGAFYRPLVRVTFALDDWLSDGRAPLVHLTNALLFLAALFGVYAAGLHLTGGKRRCSAVAAVLLAVCPVMVESHYWASGRTDLQTVALGIWALERYLVHLRTDRGGPLVASMALLLLALLTKEVAIVLTLLLPLAALLLSPVRPRPRTLLLPPGTALAYLALRGFAIGGIGGYYGTRVDPLAVGEILANVGRMLAMIAFPGATTLAGSNPPVLAFGYLAFGAAVLLATRLHRGLMLTIGATVVALAPMGGLHSTPMDGGRVLAMAMVFHTLTLAQLFALGSEWGRFVRAAGITGWLAVGVLWAGVTLREARTFLRAKEPAHAAGIFAAAETLRGDTDLLLPEPPPGHPRRILTPGAALFLHTRTLLARQEGSPIPISGPRMTIRRDRGGPRDAYAFATLELGERFRAIDIPASGPPRVTFWESARRLTTAPPADANLLPLDGAADSSASTMHFPEGALRYQLRGGLMGHHFIVLEAIADGDRPVNPKLSVQSAAGDGLAMTSLLVLPAEVGRWRLLGSVPADNAHRLVLMPTASPARFTLRSIAGRAYALGDTSPEEGAPQP